MGFLGGEWPAAGPGHGSPWAPDKSGLLREQKS